MGQLNYKRRYFELTEELGDLIVRLKCEHLENDVETQTISEEEGSSSEKEESEVRKEEKWDFEIGGIVVSLDKKDRTIIDRIRSRKGK